MKCPQCGFENPEGIKFCGDCGSKLERICPQCNAANPTLFKFCGECGQSLHQPVERLPHDLSFDEKLSKIQRYLPKGLTEKILGQRDKIEGERKHVTVMFCDMVGFTPMVEKLGPEDAYALTDKVQEILIHKVHEYEGTVNQLTGDGLMALFGAPIALKDAPQRAIRSSLAIHREMARFSERTREESRYPAVKMRIGINTGPVVLGTLGNDLRVEFAAVGDTVNTASRMEGLGEPGTSYVTEETFKLTEGFFRFEALGEKQVKGKDKPLKIYRVIAPSTRKTRFDVSAESGLTRFVGRERELEIMLDAFEQVKAGRGQAVSIVGEAGVGKSRLLYEFRKAVANEDVTFLEGKCLSYSRGVAYHPLIDILQANFGTEDNDKDSDITQKVRTGLEILEVDEAHTLPYLLELLGVEESGMDKIPMSPEGKKDRILQALIRIVLKGSEIRSLVLAIEDLHWADGSSEQASKYLMESIPGARVLMIFTYRPEFVHTWGGKSFHSQVTLNRLSNRESLAMVSHLLRSDNISSDLQELVLEKTEGVPFFIEEFVRSLEDMEILRQTNHTCHLAKDADQVAIPSTIQDVILARVDSLPEEAKELLQTGSVIEREFNYDLIQEVAGLPEQELLSQLSALKDAELLYERGIYPNSTYVFRHALTREVVYASILLDRRKNIHKVIGNTMAELFKDNVSDYCAVLAEHYINADNWEKAAEYARFAAKKAIKTASVDDAIAYTSKRVACLERMNHTDEVQAARIDARTVLGLYYAQKNLHVEAKDAVDPIVHLAEKRAYKMRLSQIYTITGSYYFSQEDYPRAFEQLEKAIKISEERGDIVSYLFANIWLGITSSFNCEFEKANRYLQKAVETNASANSLWGVSAVKSNLSLFVHYYQGANRLGYQTTAESIRIAEQSGDIYSRTLAHVSRGISCYGLRLLEESRDHLLKGVEFCETINFSSWNSFARQFLGELYFDTGQYRDSMHHYDKAAVFMQNVRGCPSWVALNKMGWAMAKVMAEEEAMGVESMYSLVKDNRSNILAGWIRRYLGEILLNIDDQHMSEAQHWIEEAIETDQRNSMRFHLGRDYALYADLFKKKGDRVQAKEQLGKAIQTYKECGADGWVTKAEEELVKLQ